MHIQKKQRIQSLWLNLSTHQFLSLHFCTPSNFSTCYITINHVFVNLNSSSRKLIHKKYEKKKVLNTVFLKIQFFYCLLTNIFFSYFCMMYLKTIYLSVATYIFVNCWYFDGGSFAKGIKYFVCCLKCFFILCVQLFWFIGIFRSKLLQRSYGV